MTPTQAQKDIAVGRFISAVNTARNEFINALTAEGFEPRAQCVMYDTCKKVGYCFDGCRGGLGSFPEDDPRPGAFHAAAQVGEQKIWPKEFWDEAMRLRRREEQNATIERCAQVIQEFDECDAWSKVDGLHITEHIAAAIRKLKDEP
jgi:hypothetical protein